ncbi:SDR family NAD(P)-dependent oxidoreductase [Ruegeria jejuensis]|uniref:SDR family NAD(P)-dependent oxidoreductase n=1 Tax=Ruegeria jejuensis TaxID=3233338 RepID=UPI00355B7526
MNSYDFNSQVAAITGGCNGIGAAIADRLAASGAKTAIWDMDISAPEERVTAIDCDNLFLTQTDVSDLASVEAAQAATEEKFGKVDVLVNCAGIAGPTSVLADYPADAWRKVQDVNTNGTFHTCRTVIPGMIARNYGRIVNVASVAGKEGNPNASAYSTSKAAVIAMTKSLGKELAGYDIAVNCITPAAAKTRIFDQVSEDFVEFMLSKIPRGRFVTVEEIANMVSWIASAENSFTTGAVFDLSGGRATY